MKAVTRRADRAVLAPYPRQGQIPRCAWEKQAGVGQDLDGSEDVHGSGRDQGNDRQRD
jgi:hypothetical protein